MKSSVVRHSRPSPGLPFRCAGGKGVLPLALLLLGISIPCAHGDPPPKTNAKAGSSGPKRPDVDRELLNMMQAILEKGSGPASKPKSKSLSNLNLLGSGKKKDLDPSHQTQVLFGRLAASDGSLSGLYQPTANTKPAPPTPPPTRREARIIDVEAENQAFEHSQLASLRAPIPQPEGPKPLLTIEQIEVAQEQRASVTKVVGSTMDKLRRCYEEALRRKSNLSGTVEWQGVLASAGMLRSGKTAGTLADSQAASCTAQTLESMAYPVSTSDQSLRITISMTVSK